MQSETTQCSGIVYPLLSASVK